MGTERGTGREGMGTDVEVVAALLWWELAAFLDKVPELRLASLEFP